MQNYYSPANPNGDTDRFNQDNKTIEGITLKPHLLDVSPSEDKPNSAFGDERLFRLDSTDSGLKLTMVDPNSYLH